MSLFVIRKILLNSSETPRKLCWVVKQHGTLVGLGFYSLRPRTSFLCNYILRMHGHLFIAVSEVGSEWFWRWPLTEYVRIWKQWTLSRKKKKKCNLELINCPNILKVWNPVLPHPNRINIADTYQTWRIQTNRQNKPNFEGKQTGNCQLIAFEY